MKIKPLSALLALVFLASGGAKLAGLEFEVAAFARWGYPSWFMYFTGVVEVAGGIGLLIGRVAALAAASMVLVMIGAVTTHVIHAEWGTLMVATVILVLAILRAWLGRNDLFALLQHR